MIRRFVLSLVFLGGFSFTAQAQTAGGANADPYYEASYCFYTASAFNDAAAAQGWKEIAAGIALERGGAGAGGNLNELDEMAADMAPLKESDQNRPEYEHCRERLAAIRQGAQAASSPVNSHAPARVAWYDRTSAATERDPARRNEAMDKIRAWDAYCAISGEALSSMLAQNTAAFGLDPQKPDPAKLIQAVQLETAKFKAQFEKDFSEAERPQLQAVYARQRENYGKGYLERRGNEKNVIAFAKQQVFMCSEGFEQIWMNLAR